MTAWGALRRRHSTGRACCGTLERLPNRRERLTKIIVLVLGLLLAYWILKAYRKRVDRRDAPPRGGTGEDMVRCDQCGIHLPRSESLTARGNVYCSAEHQRQHSHSD
jgi:uncharacterized protein